LDKYVAKGDYYFIANKIDLKNKFKEEIEKVVSIYSEKEEQYQNICGEINSEFSKIGIEEEICKGNHRYNSYSDTFGLISNYINSNENPLNLPVVYSEDLGNGITVQERFGAKPATNSIYDKTNPKMFKLIISSNIRKEHKIISVLKNGELVDTTINYFKEFDGRPKFSDNWQIKKNLERNRIFSEQEIELIKSYIDRRDNISISSEAKAETSEILTSFANQLNEALGTKIFTCNELNHDLYYYASSEGGLPIPGSLMGEGIPREDPVPLSVKIKAVYYGFRDFGERSGSGVPQSYFTEIYSAASDLERGLGTPLKFEFQPHKPYYPLEISSLNLGKSKIEVYVLTINPVTDQNDILKVEESKRINFELKGKLAKHINTANAKYVTRLSYEGDLKGLTDDAEFDGKDIMNPSSFSGDSGSYGLVYDFFQEIWDWISNLFG